MHRVLTLFLLVACASSRREAEGLSVWVEFLERDALSDAVAFAGENRLALNTAIVRGTHDRAYVAALCAEADKHQLAVRFWPLLTRAEGYWPNQSNVDPYLAWVDTLLAWGREICPHLDGIVVDMEMPIDRVEILKEMRAAGKTELDIAVFLRDGRDDRTFDAATKKLRAAADKAHAANKRFAVSTQPMLVDDGADGDDGLQRALWTPISGIPWDAVSFQVYRSLFDVQFSSGKGDYSSGLITSYAEAIVALYGDKGGMDLGSTGTGIDLPRGLPDAAALKQDVAAALAAGIAPHNIAIYSLEGLHDKPDAAAWVALPEPAHAAVTENDAFPRAIFQLFDSLD